MVAETLPENYVRLGLVSLHRDDLQRHTVDLERFLANREKALALLRCEPDTDESRAIWASVENRVDLMFTMSELAAFFNALARTWDAMGSSPVEIQ